MIPERYTINNFIGLLHEPEKILEEVPRLRRDLYRAYSRLRWGRFIGRGTRVMEEDWDYLILLDACRYDLFERINTLPGNLTQVTSLGSHSEEFAKANWATGSFHDTVYTTANGYGARVATNHHCFHDIIYSGSSGHSVTDHAHPTINGLHPKQVTELAFSAVEDYPHKRHIVHYMQPHNPYLGVSAEAVRSNLRSKGIDVWDHRSDYDPNEYRSLIHVAMQGLLDTEVLRDLYEENLLLVLEHVEQLLDEIEGLVVISSDHGELLGESYGPWSFSHHSGLYVPELRWVPWLEVEAGDRPDIIAESPQATTINSQEVDQRLAALGYK